MNNNLQKLTEEIQSLVPEICELKFGVCFIEKETGIGYQIVAIDFFINKNIPFDVIARKEGTKDFSTFSSEWVEENCKIIGRDITMLDVMIAINKRGISDTSNYCLFEDGYLGEVAGREMICHTNLSKPLHLQKQETIDNLTNLICKI